MQNKNTEPIKNESDFDKKLAAKLAVIPSGNKYPSVEKLIEREGISKEVKEKYQAFELDWEAARFKLKQIREYQLTFKGQLGFNCFLWIREHLNPLEELVEAGEFSPQLHEKIMNLKEIPPDGNSFKIESYTLREWIAKQKVLKSNPK